MEQQGNPKDNSNTDKTTTKEDPNTGELAAVASKWILDFLFSAICRRFKERNHDAFNCAISTYESIFQTPLLEGGSSQEKTLICAFLARVMQGKQLGARFEDEDAVMPLMSAAKTWFHLKDAVQDKSLFENIRVHLVIQSVAVCLEKGQRTQAWGALNWFKEHVDYPQKVAAKLSNIVAQMDIYHPFLTVFSFNRLLEMVQTFLDAYLVRNPSDFLLKEAIKVVRLSQSIDASDAAAKEVKSISDHSTLETKTKPNPQIDTARKPRVSLRWQSVNELLSLNVSSAADEQSMKGLEDTTLSLEADSSKDDVRPERKLGITKGARGSKRRLFNSNSSQLDASPVTVADRQAKTALGYVRLSGNDKADQSEETTPKTKRNLRSLQINVCDLDTRMQSQVCIRPLRKKDINDSVVAQKRIPRKWTSELDSRLVQGVRQHGKGKWSQILRDYDFEDRTGVMLKDRWRVLERTHKVN
ncbi:telomeric repeat-binding factor 1 isoform X1 [Hippocampus zosterae]|uniref:telomeric repeat-binding factor 1 isoform X1 n=2 Tax=Hippocampus zosterae TaxID=109293 RepID=UPI00223D6C1E|nr:telomeric repeat-binding factor 1 isoform X1 [Hippocampus zosterae]